MKSSAAYSRDTRPRGDDERLDEAERGGDPERAGEADLGGEIILCGDLVIRTIGGDDGVPTSLFLSFFLVTYFSLISSNSSGRSQMQCGDIVLLLFIGISIDSSKKES